MTTPRTPESSEPVDAEVVPDVEASESTDAAGADVDDDVVDAEVVETPEPPAATAAATPDPAPAAPDPAPAIPAPAPAPPAWVVPPVPGVPVDPITDYTDAGVPTLAYLQEKVERRYATALGSHELAEATIPEVTDAARRRDELATSARERLEEIRRSLHPEAD